MWIMSFSLYSHHAKIYNSTIRHTYGRNGFYGL